MSLDPFSQKQLSYRSYFKNVQALYKKPVAQTSSALILTLLTIAFFGVAAIRPTISTITELQKELAEKEEIEETLLSKIEILSKVQKQFIDNKEILESFDWAIPFENHVTDVLLELEYLAVKNNTPFSALSIGELTLIGDLRGQKQDGDRYPSVGVSISVTNEYEKLITLIQDIEHMQRYVKIESINFNESSLEDLGGQLNLGISLRIYWEEVVEE